MVIQEGSDGPLVVAIDDGYSSYDQEEEILKSVGANFIVRPVSNSEEAACEAVKDASVILVRESPVTKKVLSSAPACKAVIRYGIGVDNIDLQAARGMGIAVANVPDYGIDEVSTQTVALILAVVRRLGIHDKCVRSGEWSSGVIEPMYRLRGRTLGIVGYGRIARMTHEMLKGFGFGRVLVYDPIAELPQETQRASVDEICQQSDVIAIHAPLTNETRHLIDARRLNMMRSTAVLVNTARGGLVDLDALYVALNMGKLLGAGLDVFDPEPPDSKHPIFQLSNVVVTNHVGWYSEESMRELQRKAAEEAARVIRGEAPKHWLNK
jgi:D-3-phosphoglycerate dehydrogenase / 2-oxoglutarate reductase